ncbi:NTF2-like protein [Ceraceosorus guamensis]|uniref:NTF2-like protein n=1 Tax=Ceraceosorus guamensis TaxID=1522189 RepID=A0A316W0P7_9BASI|nr:NTF2-like protein [Ceraceosorus guamensis]PWN42678.1 NTF2-like protein [Ceraceosorus guamensis]
MAQPFINPLTGQAIASQAQSSAGSSRRSSRRGGIAGGALKRAGLIDEDVGMRSADRGSANGSSRGSGSGGTSSRGGHSSSKATARDRANPLSRSDRPKGHAKGKDRDVAAAGVAYSIKGQSHNGQSLGGSSKGGRVPGGDVTNDSKGTSNLNSKSIEVLRRFLTSRWNAEAQFLNLERMAGDEILEKAHIKAPGVEGSPREISLAMFRLAQDMFPGCVTISLAHNNFKTLMPVNALPQYLPKLQNLSLESNDLKWVRDLIWQPSMKGRPTPRFASLKELMLLGNPVRENATAAGNAAGYRAEVLAKFPHLTLLDREPVTQEELTAAAQVKNTDPAAASAAAAGVQVKPFPVAMRPGFSDEASKAIVPAFLQKYFSLFDQDRPALRPVYAPRAGFSMIEHRQVPPRARALGYQNSKDLPRQKDLNWKAYKDVPSHNIMTLGNRRPHSGFPHGPNSIVGVLTKLPKTTHPLTDASKFVVDAWVMPNTSIGARTASVRPEAGPANPSQPESEPEAVIFINVHGQFQEAPSQGFRSFSRSFIVAPVVPGSQAASSGWPCVVLEDQLIVRPYAGTHAWADNALPTDTVQPGNNSAAPAPAAVSGPSTATNPGFSLEALPPHLKGIAPAQGLNEQQHILSLQVAAQTGLTYPFAVQCLSQNAWEPSQAMTNFEQLRNAGSIPAEAFHR